VKLIDLVRKNCALLGMLEYDSTRWGWKWTEGGTDIPRSRGVYFLVSSHGIEKVGSALGRGGIRQRMSNYTRKYSQLKASDPTNMLWDTSMNGCLRGESISVYFMVVPDEEPRSIETPLGSVEVIMNPTLNIEAHFFGIAKREGEPMRLCGGSP